MPELAGWQGKALLDDAQHLACATLLAMKLIYQPAKLSHRMSLFDILALGRWTTSVRGLHLSSRHVRGESEASDFCSSAAFGLDTRKCTNTDS